ncbi:uncharacterized protein PGTG_22223 [Puccinia graminis f. sp. tritici CRL 75-36-700-3]|uniref:Uncharacterized protein n=2 Tax=Puccinia graminis f. sp. tritici TaxID=56615 RepID=H6QTX7_PUCGT|nr:uncharacterized protein PGTG_22223 [Puccinia graminis f. sp. tritici CRL 75-36-700-3]EHS64391.1 hypothetical protein PGTG_22223 [Puccinia graminis f. sp. tritici CRL 75-36-700-3]
MASGSKPKHLGNGPVIGAKLQTELNINPSRFKRPKSPSHMNPPTLPDSPVTPANTNHNCPVNKNCNGEVKQASTTKPDETGQYKSSSCHQFRHKTT